MCLCGSYRPSETTAIVKYHSIITSMRCVYLISFDREKATDALQGQHERTLHLTIFPSQPLYYQQELTTITCDRKILLISLNCHRFVEDGRRDQKKQYQSFPESQRLSKSSNRSSVPGFGSFEYLTVGFLSIKQSFPYNNILQH